jgi:hypothetical protein
MKLDRLGDALAAALVVYAYLDEHPAARARLWLAVQRGAAWTATRFGRLAITAELAYRREVGG